MSGIVGFSSCIGVGNVNAAASLSFLLNLDLSGTGTLLGNLSSTCLADVTSISNSAYSTCRISGLELSNVDPVAAATNVTVNGNLTSFFDVPAKQLLDGLFTQLCTNSACSSVLDGSNLGKMNGGDCGVAAADQTALTAYKQNNVDLKVGANNQYCNKNSDGSHYCGSEFVARASQFFAYGYNCE